jgi:hypothetical protein
VVSPGWLHGNARFSQALWTKHVVGQSGNNATGKMMCLKMFEFTQVPVNFEGTLWRFLGETCANSESLWPDGDLATADEHHRHQALKAVTFMTILPKDQFSIINMTHTSGRAIIMSSFWVVKEL